MGNSSSRSYSLWVPWRSSAANSSSPMAELTIPAKVEEALALEDGSQGHPLSSALAFDQREVPNLYRTGDGEFRFSFTEHGVAYGDKEATQRQAAVTFKVTEAIPSFALHFDSTPVCKWGINFAGSVCVRHSEGRERVIYLPGTRTYDPAGLTGDPHASERIGPSCSRTQTGVSLGELVAALKGADLNEVNTLNEQVRPLITRYHGRECLFDWMRLQVEEAVYQNRDVTPYPEFIKEWLREGRLELTEAREHTRAYIKSYNEGRPHPPLQYYKKVAAKDKVDEILTPANLEKFNQIVQT